MHADCCIELAIKAANWRGQPKTLLQDTYQGHPALLRPQRGVHIRMDCTVMACETWMAPDTFEEGGLHGWPWAKWHHQILQWRVLNFDGKVQELHGEVGWKHKWRFWMHRAPARSWGEKGHPYLPGWELISCGRVQIECLVSLLLVFEVLVLILCLGRLHIDKQKLMKKGHGQIIHVSDFVEEENGHLIVQIW